MSWFFKSLQISDDSEPSSSGGDRSTSPEESPGGVKGDLFVFGRTIGRQLRGVADFLAPPPSPPASAAPSEQAEERPPSDSSSQQAILGVRNDLVEIGGSVKSGLSRLSSNKAVAEISKFTSSLLQLSDADDHERGARGYVSEDDEFDEVPGITEEVVDFAMEISMRPECWTDFPVSLDSDFELSDAQREHVSAIEHLVPGLLSTKVEVSISMDDKQFWLIYFILLLPRLNGHDLEVLATPQVAETREMLLQKLQKKREVVESTESSRDHETPREACSREIENAEEIQTMAERQQIDHKENNDQSSEETHRSFAEEEDISFSDLEDNGSDNDLSDKQPSYRNPDETRLSSPSGSSDWVQLNRSPGTRHEGKQPSNSQGKESEGESSDWLAIDDSD